MRGLLQLRVSVHTRAVLATASVAIVYRSFSGLFSAHFLKTILDSETRLFLSHPCREHGPRSKSKWASWVLAFRLRRCAFSVLFRHQIVICPVQAPNRDNFLCVRVPGKAVVERHLQAIAELSSIFGYDIQRVRLDCHCGPASLLDQLSSRPKPEKTIHHSTPLSTVADVRAELGAEMLGAHQPEYHELCKEAFSGREFAAAVRAWVQLGEWRSELMHMFPLVVANCFHATVLVLRSVGPNVLLCPPTHAPANRVLAFSVLVVNNTKQHYDSLRPSIARASDPESLFIKLLFESVTAVVHFCFILSDSFLSAAVRPQVRRPGFVCRRRLR